MYISTFTFAKGDYDADFHALDAHIAEVARAIPGYRGEESWVNPATQQLSNVYYWDSMEALEQLMHHPAHREAKAAQARWLRGYRVTIAKVLHTYGDGRFDLPGAPAGALG